MTKKKKIAIIGHFGGNEILLDGQTVKTQVLFRELSERTDWRIQKVDTYYRHRNLPKLLIQLVSALFTTKDIIIITSQNGRRFFFPILYCFSKFFHTSVYHDVIGARLAKFTEEKPVFKKYLNSFRVNWVETDRLKQDLESVGVNNAVVLPNFKRLRIAEMDQNEGVCTKPYKLCTFSRVMKEKGIEDAINAVKIANEKLEAAVYTLDIYGPIDPEQTEWFETVCASLPSCVKYCGKVHYEDSVDTLKNYFALLFPTRYYTEGVPGTIIDAYAAGLPVIASQWESFSDVIDQGITGYGYTFSDREALTNLLFQIAEMPEMITELKENCLKKATYYLPEKSVEVIVHSIAEHH